MSAHQSIIYLGACGFCISGAIRWRKKKIGGFLFSVIWETGARYVLPYFVMLIPYAAESLADISRRMWCGKSGRDADKREICDK